MRLILLPLIVVVVFLKGMAIIGEEHRSLKGPLKAIEKAAALHNPNNATGLWNLFANK